MNRVYASIENLKKTLQERIQKGIITQETINENHATLDMPLDEFVKFQELKTLAMMHGKLNQDEAQTIYNLLGDTPETFNDQPYEVKYTLTKIFSELLNWKIKMAA